MKIKTNTLSIIAVAFSMAFTACDDEAKNTKVSDSTHEYKVTVFVQEVLEDGTLSYTREYFTKDKPYFYGYGFEGPRVRFDNIDIIAPCIIEKID